MRIAKRVEFDCALFHKPNQRPFGYTHAHSQKAENPIVNFITIEILFYFFIAEYSSPILEYSYLI